MTESVLATASRRSYARRSAPTRGGSLPVYRGRFATEQAERLLWRAGFGPKRGQAKELANLGLSAAVHSLTRPAPRAGRPAADARDR
jgi:hypothetical protein